jgi:hypothetical protein
MGKEVLHLSFQIKETVGISANPHDADLNVMIMGSCDVTTDLMMKNLSPLVERSLYGHP